MAPSPSIFLSCVPSNCSFLARLSFKSWIAFSCRRNHTVSKICEISEKPRCTHLLVQISNLLLQCFRLCVICTVGYHSGSNLLDRCRRYARGRAVYVAARSSSLLLLVLFAIWRGGSAINRGRTGTRHGSGTWYSLAGDITRCSCSRCVYCSALLLPLEDVGSGCSPRSRWSVRTSGLPRRCRGRFRAELSDTGRRLRCRRDFGRERDLCGVRSPCGL